MEADSFLRAWSFTRGLTLDLLDALDAETLLYSPGPGLGPFWKHFRHVGRVQENYTEALGTGGIHFEVTDSYSGGPSSGDLSAYLRSVDNQTKRAVRE